MIRQWFAAAGHIRAIPLGEMGDDMSEYQVRRQRQSDKIEDGHVVFRMIDDGGDSLREDITAIVDTETMATLIANASEVLNALEHCEVVLGSLEDQLKGKCHALTSVLAKARSAIFDATGETV